MKLELWRQATEISRMKVSIARIDHTLSDVLAAANSSFFFTNQLHRVFNDAVLNDDSRKAAPQLFPVSCEKQQYKTGRGTLGRATLCFNMDSIS